MVTTIESIVESLERVSLITYVPFTWESTAMGVAEIGGAIMCPGWIVTIIHDGITDVYHTSRFGGAVHASTTERKW